MRIAFCITELEAGGAERALAELAARIDRTRFEPTVYCLAPRPAGAAPPVVTRLEAADVPVHFLNARSKLHFPRAVRALTRHWLRNRPDLVQTFLFHANIVGRIAARRAGVRHVVSGIRVAERRQRWHLWVDRVTAGLVERHVCVSKSVAEFSRTRGGLPADRLVVIPNGIDVQRFRNVVPADLGQFDVPVGRRCVVCVGRLDEQKRADWLVRHSPHWMSALPDHDLLIIGEGPLRREIVEHGQRLGIDHRIHLAGWRSDVPEILAACDLLVLPSAWEGMPNVVLEAMASGLPIVATDVEGVSELLGARGSEQTVPAQAGRALAEMIAGILSKPLFAKELGSANRSRVEAEFNLLDSVRAYESLYDVLVRG